MEIRSNHEESGAVRESEPDTRPLGGLALGLSLLGALLAVTYFYSLLTYLVAVLALPLGFIARGNEPTRRMGTAAVIITVVAMVVAAAVILIPA